MKIFDYIRRIAEALEKLVQIRDEDLKLHHEFMELIRKGKIK